MNIKDIINATPHDLVIFQDGKEKYRIPPSGQAIRLVKPPNIANSLDVLTVKYGIPIVKHQPFSGIEDPSSLCIVKGYLVVSMVVADYLRNTLDISRDIYVPDTGPTKSGAIRDHEGRIIGVQQFIKY